MRAIVASLLLAVIPATKAEPVDIERMIEATAQVEGGHWGEPGGIACLSYIAWEQHRPTLAYQLSSLRDYAMPVYREHMRWIVAQLPRNRVRITPATVYTCWRSGLEGGMKILRTQGVPSQSIRCENLYYALASGK